MSHSRQTFKNLYKSVGLYENVELMVQRALDPDRPSLVKSLQKNREKLDELFSNIYIDHKMYKEDLKVTDEEFNSTLEDEDQYQFNDNWLTTIRDNYYDLVERSNDKLGNLVVKLVIRMKKRLRRKTLRVLRT